MNKIEEYKQEKDGLDILPEVPRYAAEGWEAITDGDKERLKWAGGFFSQADAGQLHDAGSHPQWHYQCDTVPHLGGNQRGIRQGFLRHHHSPTDSAPLVQNRKRARDLAPTQYGGASLIADRHGQYP